MKSLTEAQKMLKQSQDLVWLAQALVELDQESTQEALDRIQAVVHKAQDFHNVIKSEMQEFSRLN
jgi:hypothetical protein